MARKHITTEDLRRAARYVIALYESDNPVLRMVTQEAQREHRWAELALSTGLIARVILTKVDEAEEDDGAIALWLHTAVEQIVDDGDAWWIDDDTD
jgi:hypothetical protein